MRHLKSGLLVAGIVVGLVAIAYAAGSAEEGEEEIALKDLPDVVEATILEEAGDHPVQEVEKEESGDGVTYEAEWEVEDGEVEITVDPNGDVVGREKEADEDDDGDDDDD